MDTKHTTLTASDGHVLTDGNIYGKILYLAEGADTSAFYEITDEEYATIVDVKPEDMADEEDYEAALERFGVR